MNLTDRIFGSVEEDPDREVVRRSRTKQILFMILIAAVTLIVSFYSITISSSGITVEQIFGTLINQIFPGTFDIPSKTQSIVMKVYAPRVLMALIIGAILAIGGCITQTILKNPLATPYTLGVSSSASFGAGLSIILGISTGVGSLGTTLNAFIFSLIPAAIILIVSTRKNMMTTTLILIGISLSYLFSSANTLLQFFGDAEAVKAALFWTVGDLNSCMLSQVPYVFVTLLITFFLSMILLKDINIMRMGDDTATSLGINVKFIRTASIVLACFSTAVAVSFVGAIGFICLLAPQISRIFVGGDLNYLLPTSAIMGALLLSIADLIAKGMFSPIILPVGAVTAVIGAPVLIYLLIRNRNVVVS